MPYSHVTELNKCPMCGAQAKIYSNELGNNEHIARCKNALTCGLRGSAFLTEQDAADAWNKRTPVAST